MARHYPTNRLPIALSMGFAVCLTLFGMIEPAALAISRNDLNSIQKGTPFYDSSQQACLGSSGTTTLHGSDNQEKAFNYFVGKGLTAAQSAGILGNLIVESSVNPSAEEANGGPGRGIAQWGVGQRWDGKDKDGKYLDDTVYGFANGRKVDDLGLQLDFIWYEVTTGPYAAVLTAMKATKSVEDATQVWMDKYESPNPAYEHADIRKQDAQEVLTKYGNQASATVASANSFCGRSTNFATNFVFYKQCGWAGWVNDGLETQAENQAAQAWMFTTYGFAADKSFNTVCNQGCGPTAMAMIITNLTGQKVTPDMTAAYGQAHGTADPGGDGSIRDMLGPVLGGYWGLKSEPIPDFNINKINETLRNGGLVLAGGHMESHYYQGDANPHSTPVGPFSVGGHFIVIRAVTGDGKWLVGNPGGWPDDTEYDPLWILAHTTVHVAWALTRS